MASNFVKRNKTSISKIKSMLEAGIKANYTQTTRRNSIQSYVIIPKDVAGTRNEFNQRINILIPNPRILVEEFDSRLIFGLDLSRVEFEIDNDELAWSMYYCLMDMSNPDADDFTKGVYSDLGYTAATNVSAYDLRDNMSETTAFREIKMYFEYSIIPKLELSLKDGEFPFVKNRGILPVYTVDEDTGKGFYISGGDRYSTPSYRSNHVDVNLLDFTKSVSKNACPSIPVYLVQMFDGKATRTVGR